MLEVRYAPVMNDIEINLMKLMLEMDPHKRITARQALSHEYFHVLRSKDPEYQGNMVGEDEGESDSKSSVDATMGGQDSVGQLFGQNNNRILSTELF
mmetsp:Transcript_16987/g.26168  ORF Transcript_16987/g.26168 Transcript_16987/m.26168 type:complete len:97 (+) Transcript_16987:815-1105(+)